MFQAAESDIKRGRQIWREARRRFGTDGEWLFGKFGIADAMYAPVAVRFFIYDIPLDGAERDYMHSVIMHPAVQHWLEAATLEHPGDEASLERKKEVAVAASADAAAANTNEVAAVDDWKRGGGGKRQYLR